MITLTFHSVQQCQSRGIISPEEVLTACERVSNQIVRSKSWEVRVIVKTFRAKVSLPDGSNGDIVLAIVDPQSLKVKTVMLQRRSQVERKAAAGEADYIF